jgi:hypothetical protein
MATLTFNVPSNKVQPLLETLRKTVEQQPGETDLAYAHRAIIETVTEMHRRRLAADAWDATQTDPQLILAGP